MRDLNMLFPKANKYIILPSELRSTHFRSSIHNEMLTNMSEVVSENTNSYLIVQPPFKDYSLVCDDKHHANAEGRKIRTNNLIQMFKATF